MSRGAGEEVGEEGEGEGAAAELDTSQEPLKGLEGEPGLGTHGVQRLCYRLCVWRNELCVARNARVVERGSKVIVD